MGRKGSFLMRHFEDYIGIGMNAVSYLIKKRDCANSRSPLAPAHKKRPQQTGLIDKTRTLRPLNMVPRDGIEPPTRGFSVLCSTD